MILIKRLAFLFLLAFVPCVQALPPVAVQATNGTTFSATNVISVVRGAGRVTTNFIATANTDAARGQAVVTARSVAVSGDMIMVPSGIYLINTNNLAKNGVNWYFDHATVVGTNTVWSDMGAGATSFTVDGSGTFFSYGSASIEGSATVYLTNSGSRVTFNCLRITNANYAAVETIDAEVTLNVSDSIGSREYDAVWHDGVAGTGVGKVHVHCPVVVGGNNALELTGGTTWWNVDYCKGGWSGSGAPTFNISGGSNYMTSDLVDFGNGPSTLSISGGSNILSAKQVVGLVQVNSGALKLQGATVLATGSSAAIGPPGANASVILENCNLDLSQSSAVVSIGNAPGARTIRVLGTLTYDPAKPPGANISVISVDGTQNRILTVGQFTGNGAGLSNAVVIAAGSGITSTPSGNGRTYTIAATGGGGGTSFPLVADTMFATNKDFPGGISAVIVRTNWDAVNNQIGIEFNGADGRQTTLGFGYSAGNGALLFSGANERFLFSTPASIWGIGQIFGAGAIGTAALSISPSSRTLNNTAGVDVFNYSDPNKITVSVPFAVSGASNGKFTLQNAANTVDLETHTNGAAMFSNPVQIGTVIPMTSNMLSVVMGSITASAISNGLYLANLTPAVTGAGIQPRSPALGLFATAFDTDDAVARPIGWELSIRGVQNNTVSSVLEITPVTDGVTNSTGITLTSAGLLSASALTVGTLTPTFYSGTLNFSSAASRVAWPSGGSAISNSLRGVEVVAQATGFPTNIVASGYYENFFSTASGFTLTGTNSTVLLTSSGTITLPTAVGISGRRYTLKAGSGVTITLATTSSQTIDATTPVNLTAGQARTYISDNANWWIVGGFQ